MIIPSQSQNLHVKPRWVAPVGVMESVVAYNCRKYGMPRPILAMPMWEGAGNRAIDLSGHGNNGIVRGSDWVGGGLDFDKSNDYIDCGNDTTLDINNEITISVLMKFGGVFGNQGVVSKYGGTTATQSYLLRLPSASQGDVQLLCRGLSVSNITVSDAIPDTKWHQVDAIYDGSYLRIYVDGDEVGTPVASTGSINSNSTDVTIGKYSTAYYGGLIGGVYIYDVALTPVQLKFQANNLYFMYRIPEELYGYITTAPSVGNPYWYYNMLRRRN